MRYINLRFTYLLTFTYTVAVVAVLQVVEVSGLTAHLLSECDSSHLFRQCSRCSEAVHSDRFLQHTRDNSCRRMSIVNACTVVIQPAALYNGALCLPV